MSVCPKAASAAGTINFDPKEKSIPASIRQKGTFWLSMARMTFRLSSSRTCNDGPSSAAR
jgi:hypothetical protein